ncbi:MAG: nucleotide exchange factor GrpE [Patescibacteria group bacterium]|nr:nucleotide exchange factor GrpE [Patescibacteria group bacterium]
MSDEAQQKPGEAQSPPEPQDWHAKAEEYLNAWKRAAADFENYKKRRHKEDQALIIFARLHVLERLLPIFEAIEQSLAHVPQGEGSEQWKKGMEETLKQLHAAFSDLGIEKIKTVGEKYDHELHEAVEMVEGGESGQITEEVAAGWRINGQTVRPAKVKVAR